jgi:hypothetical protein
MRLPLRLGSDTRNGCGPLGDVTCRIERGTNRGIWTSAVLNTVSVHVIDYVSCNSLPPLYMERKAKEIGNRMPIAAHRDYGMEVGRAAAAFMVRRTRMRQRHALSAE